MKIYCIEYGSSHVIIAIAIAIIIIGVAFLIGYFNGAREAERSFFDDYLQENDS